MIQPTYLTGLCEHVILTSDPPDFRYDFLSEQSNGFESVLWIHTWPMNAKVHGPNIEFPVVPDNLLRDFFWTTNDQTILF